MSQPTQPHQAPSSSHSSSQSPQHVQQPALGMYTPPHGTRALDILSLLYNDAESMKTSSSILFCTLARSCSSVPLVFFVTSVTSSKDETAIFRVLAMALGAVIFYGAGLLTYLFR